MSAPTYTNVWVCSDCYFAHHYGQHQHDEEWFAGESDSPCDREPWGRWPGQHDISDDSCSPDVHDARDGHWSEDDDEQWIHDEPCSSCGHMDDGMQSFSWNACHGCGSSLGGARYRMAVWS